MGRSPPPPAPPGNVNADVAVKLSRRCHPLCMVCGSHRAGGLGLIFQHHADGSVSAEFDCAYEFQGYPDRLHGGVVAMLLDAAMTHCLFARNVIGVTAKLNIRYHRGVTLETPAVVRARVLQAASPLTYCAAELIQNGAVCARAKATFWESAGGDSAGLELALDSDD